MLLPSPVGLNDVARVGANSTSASWVLGVWIGVHILGCAGAISSSGSAPVPDSGRPSPGSPAQDGGQSSAGNAVPGGVPAIPGPTRPTASDSAGKPGQPA